MPQNPFKTAEKAANSPYVQQRTSDLTGSILQTGASSARAVQSVGQATATVGDVYEHELEEAQSKIDTNDYMHATNEVNNQYREYDRRIKAARNKAEVKQLQTDFNKYLSNYTGSENPSGVRNLQSERTRSKFTTDFAPKAKSSMIDAVNAKNFEIIDTDRRVKFKTTEEDIISGASSPQDVDTARLQLKVLYDNNLSKEQSSIALKEGVNNAAANSIVNQMNGVVMEPGVGFDAVSQTADALRMQTSLYDFDTETKDKLESYLTTSVRRFATQESASVQTAKAQAKAQQTFEKGELYDIIRDVKNNPGLAQTKWAEYSQKVDNSSLDSKTKLQFEDDWRSLADPKKRESHPDALRLLGVEFANTENTTEQLKARIDQLAKSKRLTSWDASEWYGKADKRLAGTEKELAATFIEGLRERALFDDPITIDDPGMFSSERKLELPEFAKKEARKRELQQQWAQISNWAQEWIGQNPGKTHKDVTKAFESDIINLTTKGAEISLEEAILKSKSSMQLQQSEKEFDEKVRGSRRMRRAVNSKDFLEILRASDPTDRGLTTPTPEISE